MIVEDVRAVARQQRNKASMTSDKRMMGTPVVEHGKQRWRTVNGTRTIERSFYQLSSIQRRRSGTAKSLIHKSRRHQSFDPRCTLSPSFARFCETRISSFVLVALSLACRKKMRFFGVWTAVWPHLLLFSGAFFRRKPSNAPP